MGGCVTHITRKDWYRNCNKGCQLCFGYNCDMCSADLKDLAKRCGEVLCFFCSFSCCECECIHLKACAKYIHSKIIPCCEARCEKYCECSKQSCDFQLRFCGRVMMKCLKECSNECDDMCECHCYCENPCIFRDANNKQLQQYLSTLAIKQDFFSHSVFGMSIQLIFKYVNDTEITLYDVYHFEGTSSILRDTQTGQYLTLKVIEHNDDNKFLQADSAFRKRSHLYHPNFLNLHQVESFTEDSFCSSKIRNMLFFDYVVVNLEKEIVLRMREKVYFKLDEVWNLIEGCLSVMNFFQDMNLEHRALRPSRIYASMEGAFKIADPYLLRSSFNFDDAREAYLTAEQLPLGIYLSPDQFMVVQVFLYSYSIDLIKMNELIFVSKRIVNEEEYKKRPVFESHFKSDAFTLGMIFLSTITLQDLSSFYDYESGVIDLQGINRCILSACAKYNSLPLQQLLLGLLDANQDRRLDCRTAILSIKLNQHILNCLKNFRKAPLPSVPVPITFAQPRTEMMQVQVNLNMHPTIRNAVREECTKIDGYPVNFGISGFTDPNHIRLSELGTIATENSKLSIFQRLNQLEALRKLVGCCCQRNNEQVLNEETSQLLPEVKKGMLYQTFNQKRFIIYEGDLLEGRIKHGEGRIYEENNYIYDGQFYYDTKNGEGKITDPLGNIIFEGSFLNNMKHGKGKERNPKRLPKTLHTSISKTNIKDADNYPLMGKLSGCFDPKYVHLNWDTFEGEYQEGRKNGKGIYSYSDGQTMECNFVNNFVEGEAILRDNKDTIILKVNYKRSKLLSPIDELNPTIVSINQQSHNQEYYVSQLQQGRPQSLNLSLADHSFHSLILRDNLNNQNNNEQVSKNVSLKRTNTINLIEDQSQ